MIGYSFHCFSWQLELKIMVLSFYYVIVFWLTFSQIGLLTEVLVKKQHPKTCTRKVAWKRYSIDGAVMVNESSRAAGRR